MRYNTGAGSRAVTLFGVMPEGEESPDHTKNGTFLIEGSRKVTARATETSSPKGRGETR